MKILLIEDDIQDVELLQEYLSEGNNNKYILLHANRLNVGIELLKTNPIDVVITDLGLPDSLGIETFHRLNVTAPTIPIIVLTNLKDEKIGERAVRDGAQDYLVKDDIDAKLLSRALRYAVERKAIEKNLKESNSIKDLLLDVITHDLKNPCGTVYSLAELLYEDGSSDEIIEAIMNSSRKIIKVIDNATILAQTSCGDSIEMNELNLSEIINELIEEFGESVKSAGMAIDYKGNGEFLAQANPIISEVIKNYISNAIKYANTGKKIVIIAHRAKDEIIVKVKDYGVTIPITDRDRIFERLYQMGNGKSRGRGLGLSIVKRIIETHNGEAWVEPNKPSGNIFCFSLPSSQ
jgi:signal transduction histidine kinase